MDSTYNYRTSKLPVRKKDEWTDIQLEENYFVSFQILGDNILLVIPRGKCKLDGMKKLYVEREKVLRECKLWNKPHVEIKDYKYVPGLPARGTRETFKDFLAGENKRNKLRAYIGFNSPAPVRWIFNINIRTSSPRLYTVMVKDFDSAVAEALKYCSGRRKLKRQKEKNEDEVYYSKNDIDMYIDDLLRFMENVSWFQDDLELNEANSSHPFKVLYDVFSVIKMDFKTMLGKERQNIDLLKESEEKYRMLSENLKDLIFLTDNRMNIKSVAGNALGTLGFSRFELLSFTGEEFLTFFHPNDLELLKKKAATALEESKDTVCEARFKMKSGGYIWLEIAFSSLYKDESIIGLHGFIRNIGEKKRIEDKLTAIQQQLVETALQAGKAELATGIMHDIGNILNGVNISTETIAEQVASFRIQGLLQATEMLIQHMDDPGDYLKNDEKGKLLPSYLKKVGESLENQQKIMNGELNLLKTKIETIKDSIWAQQKYAKSIPSYEELNLYSVIDDAIILESSFLNKYGIRVEKKYSGHLPILAEKSKLIHVLINILKNAAEAMESTELAMRVIKIAIIFPEPKKDSDDNSEPGERIIIEISDNGIGIEEKNLDKIFLYGMTTKSSGHGFGLHISMNYISEMGGRLYAKSEGIGKGTVFCIEIPGKKL